MSVCLLGTKKRILNDKLCAFMSVCKCVLAYVCMSMHVVLSVCVCVFMCVGVSLSQHTVCV